MADYEQKIFEQVIDTYFCDSQSNGNVIAHNIVDKDLNYLKSVNEDRKLTDSAKKKRESKSKAVLIESEHPENLPKGWKKVVVQRTTGATAGKFDVYFFTPSGRKLRSKNEIKDYSEKHQLDLDVSTFGFSRPRKEKYIQPKCITKRSKSASIDGYNNLASVNSGTLDVSDCNNHTDDQVSLCKEETVPNGDSSEIHLGNLIDQDMRAFAEEVLEQSAIELGLPNRSFTNTSSESTQCVTATSTTPTLVAAGDGTTGTSNSVDTEHNHLSHLGKTFRIERPLSFSCF